MPLRTIVEDYIIAAMKRASYEPMQEGIMGASVPGCPGVLAFGADIHACAAALYVRLEDWIRVSLENGQQLPVIDEIDLNSEMGQLLASYHGGSEPSVQGEFYENEDELEAAFAGRNKAS
jgi:hypothetical protein